jgi:hypothetical protein
MKNEPFFNALKGELWANQSLTPWQNQSSLSFPSFFIAVREHNGVSKSQYNVTKWSQGGGILRGTLRNRGTYSGA